MVEVVERDRERLAQRHGDAIERQGCGDETDPIAGEIARRDRQQHDEHHAGEERRAQIHERERLAMRVVGVPAGGAVLIFSVSPPPPEDRPDPAARAPHPQASPEDPACPAHDPRRISRTGRTYALFITIVEQLKMNRSYVSQADMRLYF